MNGENKAWCVLFLCVTLIVASIAASSAYYYGKKSDNHQHQIHRKVETWTPA